MRNRGGWWKNLVGNEKGWNEDEINEKNMRVGGDLGFKICVF